jgi:hypothetical protein
MFEGISGVLTSNSEDLASTPEGGDRVIETNSKLSVEQALRIRALEEGIINWWLEGSIIQGKGRGPLNGQGFFRGKAFMLPQDVYES